MGKRENEIGTTEICEEQENRIKTMLREKCLVIGEAEMEECRDTAVMIPT